MNKKLSFYFLKHGRVTFFVCILTLWYSNAYSQQLFRIHGSNTVGAKLAPELAKLYLREVLNAQHIETLSSAINEESVIRGYDRITSIPLDIEIFSHGSSTGFTDLANHTTDIAMSSRRVKMSEVESLAAMGDLTSLAAEKIVGLDGVAVIVHRSNPLAKLEKAQLTAIFSGKITNWKLITGVDAPIKVYARDNKSGTYDTFKSLILSKTEKLIANAERFESNSRLSAAVANDPNAIGFVGLPYINQSKAIAVKDGEGEARAPNMLNVATEDYALSRRLYMYVSVHNTNAYVTEFIQFIESEQAQKVVEKVGFVSKNITANDVVVSDAFPAEYRTFTKDAKRLSSNIYFKRGSLTPDNKAVHDIKRISDYIKKHRQKIKQVMLFGFSEDSQVPMFNISLSETRADFIESLLKKDNIVVDHIRGYGYVNPVTSGHSVDKNRRIEVWIK